MDLTVAKVDPNMINKKIPCLFFIGITCTETVFKGDKNDKDTVYYNTLTG